MNTVKTLKALVICLIALTAMQPVAAQNQLTIKEQKAGWQSLFDGKTTKGWHSYLQPNVGPCWKVVDGSLQLDPQAQPQSDIVTDKEYENFDLSVEWKIAEAGNSGIIFSIHEAPEFPNTFETGMEMQVLDDAKAEDNKYINHLAGSLYDLKTPSKKVVKPAGEWNLARIKKQDGHLTYWLNNSQIVDIMIGSAEWKQLLEKSKFKTWKGYAAYPKGRIALQSHGSVVSYRNMKIKEL
jgi:hypothetical protein